MWSGLRCNETTAVGPVWRLAVAVLIAMAAANLAGCGGSGGADVVVDVYAASSLTDAFGELEQEFEQRNPGVDIRLNLAGSSTLQRQILDGAPADVYAPADVGLIEPLGPAAVDAATVYASNTLTLIVPDPADGPITSPADLSGDGLLIARCASGVPCGDATDRYLGSVGLDLGRTTDETNVRSVLLKIVAGEADAGFVYVTDARARPDEVIEIPLDDPPTTELGLTVLSDQTEAAAFVAYVVSDDGAEVLQRHGFDTP